MNRQKRIRDYGVTIGTLKTGDQNAITDVPGVTVGHATINDGDTQTGVTAVIPHKGNLFREKVVAASHVFNGYGKTVGTIQINELGTIETPILLTNTLSVGAVSHALTRYMLDQNPEIGREAGTVNPIVCECNDMYINDIRADAVKQEHVLDALQSASETFYEGAVGAGRGMVCFGLKGGIGSASRKMSFSFGNYTLGILVLANFGRLSDFTLAGRHIGPEIMERKESLLSNHMKPEKGSIIIIVATDLPVTHRQLVRIIKRTGIGLARTGSVMGNGSGDVVIGFTTHRPSVSGDKQTIASLTDDAIDQAFYAAVEGTEEAILNALATAETTIGRDSHIVYGLSEFIKDIL
ncbi:P1 family peptidase [Camelliibacillus cellulosilyticus]|uniref:P1 family peptidase n=1 Tax=Camelliibacillus cellulosilyticus TaxID=2174486 RepID=A0ABV9GRM5_9BACL